MPVPYGRRLTHILSEWKTLARLGLPVLIAQLAQMANGVVDTVMAGHVSAEDLAAVGIGTSVWMPLYLFLVGVLSVLQPIISSQNGARVLDRVMPTVWQGIYVASVGVIILSAVLLNMDSVLDRLKLDNHTAGIAQGYLTAVAWGLPPMLLMAVLRGLTDGLGHTRVFMLFSLLAALLNLPLNYVFIYGKLGLPAMGGVGCGWATAISSWLAGGALLFFLNVSRTYRHFRLLLTWAPPNRAEIKTLLSLGLPIGFTIFFEVSVFLAIALFLAPLGPVVVAGHQIVLNFISLLFMVPLSLGMALTLRVSFLVGAQQPDSARLLALSSLLLAIGIALVYAPVLLLFRHSIAALYTSDLEVQRVATRLLMFAALFQIADVLQVAAIGALRGFHDTRTPMLIMLLSFWGISLPLGYSLTFTDWFGEPRGASGFWMALIVGLSCAGLLLTVRLLTLKPK